MVFSFDMTEDPARFEEAVEVFVSRKVVTRAEADALEDYARQRVWWISGVAQMDIVNDAHASLVKAMDEGVSFEDWKKEFGPKLEAAWGREDGHRLLTIYRNATHFAYATGRERQMRDPAVMVLRPYVEFVAVEDLAECEICADCDGVILPIDHPWWDGHSPLMHHCCRCQKRSLRAKTALATGVTQVPPEVTADDGFGLRPDRSVPPKPVERETPPDPKIHRELYLKQEQDKKKRKPKTVTLKPEHDPQYWAEKYAATYPDPKVAEKIGYGRAILERSKGLSLTETKVILDKLSASGMTGISDLWYAVRLEQITPGTASPKNLDAARFLAQHVRLLQGGQLLPEMEKGTRSVAIKSSLSEVKSFFENLSSPKLKLPIVKWEAARVSRESYCPGLNRIRVSSKARPHPGVAVHEYAHAVEHLLGHVETSKLFISTRTAGDKLISLQRLLPGRGYHLREVARPDKFWKPYMGKEYPRDHSGTEMVSMVSGEIAAGNLAPMLEADPESVFFVLGLLAGY